MEQYVGRKIIDAAIVGPKVDVSNVSDRLIIQDVLEASDIPYRHDRHLLRAALEKSGTATRLTLRQVIFVTCRYLS